MQSYAFSNLESSGAYLRGAGEAPGSIDCTCDWVGEGQDQDGAEESGLQFEAIRCLHGRTSGKSAGKK